MKKFTHDDLLNTMNAFKFKNYNNVVITYVGLCGALCCVWAQVEQLGEKAEEHFYNVIQNMAEYKDRSDELINNIEQTKQEKIGLHDKIRALLAETTPLTHPADKLAIFAQQLTLVNTILAMLLDINAVLENLAIYQRPFEHLGIFEIAIEQTNIELISSVTTTPQGAIKRLTTLCFALSRSQLEDLLTHMAQLFEAKQFSPVFLVSSSDHGTINKYDLKKKQWKALDINDPDRYGGFIGHPRILKTNELANSLRISHFITDDTLLVVDICFFGHDNYHALFSEMGPLISNAHDAITLYEPRYKYVRIMTLLAQNQILNKESIRLIQSFYSIHPLYAVLFGEMPNTIPLITPLRDNFFKIISLMLQKNSDLIWDAQTESEQRTVINKINQLSDKALNRMLVVMQHIDQANRKLASNMLWPFLHLIQEELEFETVIKQLCSLHLLRQGALDTIITAFTYPSQFEQLKLAIPYLDQPTIVVFIEHLACHPDSKNSNLLQQLEVTLNVDLLNLILQQGSIITTYSVEQWDALKLFIQAIHKKPIITCVNGIKLVERAIHNHYLLTICSYLQNANILTDNNVKLLLELDRKEQVYEGKISYLKSLLEELSDLYAIHPDFIMDPLFKRIRDDVYYHGYSNFCSELGELIEMIPTPLKTQETILLLTKHIKNKFEVRILHWQFREFTRRPIDMQQLNKIFNLLVTDIDNATAHTYGLLFIYNRDPDSINNDDYIAKVVSTLKKGGYTFDALLRCEEVCPIVLNATYNNQKITLFSSQNSMEPTGLPINILNLAPC